MLTESDKIVRTTTPALPSRCCVCGFAADGTREFLDFQMSLDVYGSVNICDACVAPVAELFNYVAKSEVEEEKIKNQSLSERLAEVEAENERLNNTLDSIVNLRSDSLRDYLRVDDESDESSPEGELESGDDDSEEGRDDRKTSKPAAKR